jgi:hypothetical protein
MVNQDVSTIIVSHQLERIGSLCKRAVLLRQGEVAHAGAAAETIAAYVTGVSQEARQAGAGAPITIRSADLLTDGRTISGSRVLVRVSAEVVDPARLDDTTGIVIRVRSMQNGKVLFATSSQRQGISLKGHTRVTLDVSLQLNTAPGVYAIETLVFDRKRGQPLADGPWINVTVQEGKSFHGDVQMNPEMSLHPPARPDRRLTLMGDQGFDPDEERQARQPA